MLYFAWCRKDTPETLEALPAASGEKIILCHYTQKENKAAECMIHMVGVHKPLQTSWAMIGVYQENTPFIFMKAQRVAYETQGGIHSFTFRGTSDTVEKDKLRLWQEQKSLASYDDIFFSTEEKNTPDTLLRVTPATWFIDPKSHQVSLNPILPQTSATQEVPTYRTFHIKTHKKVPQIQGKVVVRWVQDKEYLENWMPHIERCYPQNRLTLKGDQWEKKWPIPGQFLGGSFHYKVMQSSLTPINQEWTLHTKDHRPYMTPKTQYQGVLLVKTTVQYHRHEVFTFSLGPPSFEGEKKTLTLPLHIPSQDKKVLDWQPCHTYRKNDRVAYQGGEYVITQNHTSGVQPQVIYWSKVEEGWGFDYGASFFLTDRGKKAASYALDLAKVAFIREARTLEVSLKGQVCDWKDITVKDTLYIKHRHLPQGGMPMKVTAVSFYFKAQEHWSQVTLQGLEPVEEERKPQGTLISDAEVYARDYSQESYHIQHYTWTSDQDIVCQSYDSQLPPAIPHNRVAFTVNTTSLPQRPGREGIEMILPGSGVRRALYHTITGHLPYGYYPKVSEDA